MPRPLPLGEVDANVVSRRRGRGCFSAAPPLPQEAGAANAACHYDPTRENGIAERPQTLRYPKIKNNSSAEYAQSSAEGIFNRSPPRDTRRRAMRRTAPLFPPWKAFSGRLPAAKRRSCPRSAPDRQTLLRRGRGCSVPLCRSGALSAGRRGGSSNRCTAARRCSAPCRRRRRQARRPLFFST